MGKNIKIGLTGIAAIVILFCGIKFLKGAKLFSTESTYYIQFENTKGLSRSSAVYADGYKVGIVSEILYDYSHPGNLLVQISTDPKLRIPKGSVARLDEAILGGCTLNMTLAHDSNIAYEEGDTIIGDNSQGLMKKAGEIIPDVARIVERMDTLIATLNSLVANPNLPLIMENTSTMMKELNATSSAIKKLAVQDIPRLTQTYIEVGENTKVFTDHLSHLNLQQTMDSVNYTIGNVNNMITQMQSTEGTLGLLMKDPTLYKNINHTVQSADSLVVDLKAHPKRYVHFSVFGKKDK